MVKIFFVLFLFFILNEYSFAAEFGEYQYKEYLGVQQMLQNQRAMAQRRQMRYNTNPTRNIKYPNRYSQYPNIETKQTHVPLSARQRYSPAYFNRRYYQN